jgi:hypothetical protein
MNNRHLILFSLLAVLLAACFDIADPDQVKKQPTDQLCEDYYFTRHPSPGTSTDWPTKQADIKKELDKRKAIEPGEWTLIDQGKLQPGMSECALKASWGFPVRVTHAVTVNGESEHYTYTLTRYVDVANGKVTGFGY